MESTLCEPERSVYLTPIRGKIKRKLFESKAAKECQKLVQNCSLFVEPRCLRLKHKFAKKEFHINVIDVCEVQYLKCHKGYEATQVPLKHCGVDFYSFHIEKLKNGNHPVKPHLKERPLVTRPMSIPAKGSYSHIQKTTAVPANLRKRLKRSLDDTPDTLRHPADKSPEGGRVVETVSFLNRPKKLSIPRLINKQFWDNIESSDDKKRNPHNMKDFGRKQEEYKETTSQDEAHISKLIGKGHGGISKGTTESSEYDYVNRNVISNETDTEQAHHSSLPPQNQETDSNETYVDVKNLSEETVDDPQQEKAQEKAEEEDESCPQMCAGHDVMVCARCQDGIYKTFLSECHMRLFVCSHENEKLELISRLPCLLSAPYLEEESMKPNEKLSDVDDDERIRRFIRCRDAGKLDAPPNPVVDEKCDFSGDQEMLTDDKK